MSEVWFWLAVLAGIAACILVGALIAGWIVGTILGWVGDFLKTITGGP